MSQYKTGTVSVTNGSATVTGSGTLWNANLAAGNLFTKEGDNVAYTIASVDSDTVIQLTTPYAGSTSSGSNYGVTIDFTSNGLPLLSPQDLNTAAIYNEAIKNIDNDLSSIDGVLSGLGTAAQADLTSPSAIIFDDGNLEVDRYGLSVAVNGVLGVGVVLDSSTVSIYLPTNRKISATSLSVTSTFSVKESDETLIGSGVTVTDMSLSSRRSNRITKINISGFSGLIKNTPVELRAESTSSLIEIT